MKKLLILTSCLVCVLLLSAACGIEISKGPGDEKAASILLMQEVFITSVDFSCVRKGERTVFGYDLNMLY